MDFWNHLREGPNEQKDLSDPSVTMNLPHATETPLPGKQAPLRKGFMDFSEGEIYTGIGRTIEELIMKTDTCIVFIDEYGGVQWGADSLPCSDADYDVVCNRVADLETKSRFLVERSPCPPGKKISEHEAQLFAARRLIAEGMARLLDTGSLEAAQGILGTAEKWISQRSLAYSRRWLLRPFAILALGGLAVFFSLLLSWGSIPANGSPWLWLLGALLGGAGALVSAVLFNRKIPIDATAGLSLHEIEAVLRWTVGVAAGLIVQLLIQGGLFLGLLARTDTNPAAALALSFLAGLSELFFPTLLRNFDQGGGDKPEASS